MLSRLGIEASQAAQYVIAFVIILVLVALFGLVLRRLTGGRLMLPGQDRGRARQPRLGIVDIYDLDRQRQLILLRRDNVEHLLLIGGPNDVVIETNIVRVAGARIPAAATDAAADRAEPTFERPAEPTRPQIEPNGRPSIESQLAARLGSFGREARPDGEEAPAAARVEPVLKPSAVTLATPPAPPPSPPAPAPTPMRPPLGSRPETAPPVRPATPAATPRLEPAASRPTPRPEPRPFPAAPTPPAPPPPPPARPAPTPAPERNADAAVLSDMAKQLEEALKRPSPPSPTPNRVLPALDNPRRDENDLVIPPARPVPPAPPARYEPTRSEPTRAEPARPDPARAEPAPRPEPVRPEPRPETKPEPVRPEPPRPAPPPAPQPAPVRAAPPPSPPPSPPAPPRAAPPPPPPPAAPPAQSRPVDDPFSVDEIEAEFARLLGRPSGGNGKN